MEQLIFLKLISYISNQISKEESDKIEQEYLENEINCIK
jgi:hypothetical protein